MVAESFTILSHQDSIRRCKSGYRAKILLIPNAYTEYDRRPKKPQDKLYNIKYEDLSCFCTDGIKSQGHDEICDYLRTGEGEYEYSTLNLLLPYRSYLLKIENSFEELIGKITDLQMNSKILKSYLYSYKNNSDHFEDLIAGAPDYYDFWYDENDRTVTTPTVMDKTKEKSFFKKWNRKYKKGIRFKFHLAN